MSGGGKNCARSKRLLTTTRLLTLTGSGGVGKTKLALRAAAEMARGFPDGAWLVLLSSIGDPLLVTQAVFGALGAHDLAADLSLSVGTMSAVWPCSDRRAAGLMSPAA